MEINRNFYIEFSLICRCVLIHWKSNELCIAYDMNVDHNMQPFLFLQKFFKVQWKVRDKLLFSYELHFARRILLESFKFYSSCQSIGSSQQKFINGNREVVGSTPLVRGFFFLRRISTFRSRSVSSSVDLLFGMPPACKLDVPLGGD
jgi:hypothetical protein